MIIYNYDNNGQFEIITMIVWWWLIRFNKNGIGIELMVWLTLVFITQFCDDMNDCGGWFALLNMLLWLTYNDNGKFGLQLILNSIETIFDTLSCAYKLT